MGRFFEVIKGVPGESEEKSAQITDQTCKFRGQSGEVPHAPENRIIQDRRKYSDNCIKHKIVQPGEAAAGTLVERIKKVPHPDYHRKTQVRYTTIYTHIIYRQYAVIASEESFFLIAKNKRYQ